MKNEEESYSKRTSQALPALKKSFGRTSMTLRCLCINLALSARDFPLVPGVRGGALLSWWNEAECATWPLDGEV